MKNVAKNEKAHGLMKAGLALLLSGSVACGGSTSYSEYVRMVRMSGPLKLKDSLRSTSTWCGYDKRR